MSEPGARKRLHTGGSSSSGLLRLPAVVLASVGPWLDMQDHSLFKCTCSHVRSILDTPQASPVELDFTSAQRVMPGDSKQQARIRALRVHRITISSWMSEQTLENSWPYIQAWAKQIESLDVGFMGMAFRSALLSGQLQLPALRTLQIHRERVSVAAVAESRSDTNAPWLMSYMQAVAPDGQHLSLEAALFRHSGVCSIDLATSLRALRCTHPIDLEMLVRLPVLQDLHCAQLSVDSCAPEVRYPALTALRCSLFADQMSRLVVHCPNVRTYELDVWEQDPTGEEAALDKSGKVESKVMELKVADAPKANFTIADNGRRVTLLYAQDPKERHMFERIRPILRLWTKSEADTLNCTSRSVVPLLSALHPEIKVLRADHARCLMAKDPLSPDVFTAVPSVRRLIVPDTLWTDACVAGVYHWMTQTLVALERLDLDLYRTEGLLLRELALATPGSLPRLRVLALSSRYMDCLALAGIVRNYLLAIYTVCPRLTEVHISGTDGAMDIHRHPVPSV